MAVTNDGFQATPAVGGLLTARLSTMMFMQFFVWGAWTVTLGLVMQTVGIGNLIGNAFSVGPIASIVGSFLLGMAAARYVSPRMLMVILHLVGGVLLFLLPSLVTPENGRTFVWLLLCYMILYMPTVGLANTIALKSFGERTDKFPFVRAFGTLGWITAGLIIGWAGLSASPRFSASPQSSRSRSASTASRCRTSRRMRHATRAFSARCSASRRSGCSSSARS